MSNTTIWYIKHKDHTDGWEEWEDYDGCTEHREIAKAWWENEVDNDDSMVGDDLTIEDVFVKSPKGDVKKFDMDIEWEPYAHVWDTTDE